MLSYHRDIGWIVDSGAIDHMTYDKSFFHFMTTPTKTSVVTANGKSSSVTGANSITLTHTLSLHKILLVHALSHNLLSVEQVTKQLD